MTMIFDLFDLFDSQCPPENISPFPEEVQADGNYVVPLLDRDGNSLFDSEIDADQNGIPDAMETADGIVPFVDENENSLQDSEIDVDQNGILDAMEVPREIAPLVDAAGDRLLDSEIDADQNGIPDTMETSFLNNYQENSTNYIGGILSPVLRIFDDLWYEIIKGCDDIVTENHFSSDGTYDNKNNVIVEGNVVHDMQFTQQQRGPTCSLMAQEQFVHRYRGEELSETELEEVAEEMGIYRPGLSNPELGGTRPWGLASILDICHIPHQRLSGLRL